MKKLERGDQVRVRLHTGEVVEAGYSHKAAIGPNHWVIHNNEKHQAVGIFSDSIIFPQCRFVGNPCVLVPVGVKLSEKLWCDLKSDSEKHSWLLMGRARNTKPNLRPQRPQALTKTL
jgi:hypothetical protein